MRSKTLAKYKVAARTGMPSTFRSDGRVKKHFPFYSVSRPLPIPAVTGR